MNVQRWVVGCVALCALTACAGASPSNESTTPISATTDAATLHRFANALAVQGDLVRAEQYAVLAMERGLSPRVVLPLLLTVCLRASRVTAALAHAEPVLREDPSNYRLRFVVASLYAALARREDAMRELVEVLRAAPTHSAATRLLSRLEESGQ